MANYKVEVTKRFGVFHVAFYAATPGAKAPALDKQPSFRDLNAVLAHVKEKAEALNWDEDAIIFRGIAYSNLGELEQIMKRAPY